MSTLQTPPVAIPAPIETASDKKRELGRWMALTAALLGWMFDGAEMGVFSMVGRPALNDLMRGASEQVIGLWFGVITAAFLVGAATGGVLFGWLGDRIGRVRAMTLSVLVYALFTGLCGISATAWQLGAMRFIAALGMGGEWSLGVALVMEVWPNKSRVFMAGLIGAAAPVGYMLVGFLGLGLSHVLDSLAVGLADIGVQQDWIDWLLANRGWRILLVMGVTPALLTFFVRLFVPESHQWEREQEAGSTSHWATIDLLGVLVGAAGPALIIVLWAGEFSTMTRLSGTAVGLAVATAGYMYPAFRFLQRQAKTSNRSGLDQLAFRRMLLAAALSGVPLLGTWGATQWAPAWADKLASGGLHAKEWTQVWSSAGSIVGTLAAAFLAERLGRRIAYVLMCVLSIVSLLVFYRGNTAYGPMFLPSVFLVGATTAAFYGWLPLYLPELFPTSIRATGQGFGFNFGRILAAVGALQAGNLFAPQITLFGTSFAGGYPFACSLMSAIYLVGLAIIWLAPETRGQPLPD